MKAAMSMSALSNGVLCDQQGVYAGFVTFPGRMDDVADEWSRVGD